MYFSVLEGQWVFEIGGGDMEIIDICFNRSFKMIKIDLEFKPKNISELFWMVWGFDIFMNNIPFLKTIIVANIIVWSLLFI